MSVFYVMIVYGAVDSYLFFEIWEVSETMQKEKLIDKFIEKHQLEKEEYIELFSDTTEEMQKRLKEEAVRVRKLHYGNKVYVRGLIEFTNYCKNNCYYCGIRGGNKQIERYRLSEEEIMACCKNGHALGIRTFVLQGGEDGYFTDEKMERIVKKIKENYSDCAITLSIGERSLESYKRLKAAGADRYLLRHETAEKKHYGQLHPEEMKLEHRMECLFQLKELGYQVGAGFMVGSPGQTPETLAEDFLFLKKLSPQMVGIGPFVPHHETPFAEKEKGSVDQTLLLLSMIRILLPKVLLPATTALGTLDPKGREKGLQAGANVVMPNLSPVMVRKKYELYDAKICTGEEAVECIPCLERRIQYAGYEMARERGDAKDFF